MLYLHCSNTIRVRAFALIYCKIGKKLTAEVDWKLVGFAVSTIRTAESFRVPCTYNRKTFESYLFVVKISFKQI